MTNAAFASTYLLGCSHMNKIDVFVNSCHNTINLQLIQYIIEDKIICCVQTSIFLLINNQQDASSIQIGMFHAVYVAAA